MVVMPGLTMAFTESNTWRTMRPLRFIFSSSVGDLQTMAIDQLQRLRANLIHTPAAVDLDQLPLGPVILDQGQRVALIRLQTLGDYLLAIITAGDKPGVVNVAQVSHAGRRKVNVVDPPAGGT